MSLERHMKVVSPATDVVDAATPALKVAFATSDLKTVDEHFGSASRLANYEVTAQGHRFVDVSEFSDTRQDGNENKLPAKLDALRNQHGVIAIAIGASAVRQLVAGGTQPIKLGEATKIVDLLEYLSQQIAIGQTPWIQKAIQPATDKLARLEEELDELWDE
ncbi:MAG: NifB/NifX family molybdenum-iron cluster-binding protein [Planctomycetota bacterium]